MVLRDRIIGAAQVGSRRCADTGIFNARIENYLFIISIGWETGIHFSIHFLVAIDLNAADFCVKSEYYNFFLRKRRHHSDQQTESEICL